MHYYNLPRDKIDQLMASYVSINQLMASTLFGIAVALWIVLGTVHLKTMKHATFLSLAFTASVLCLFFVLQAGREYLTLRRTRREILGDPK